MSNFLNAALLSALMMTPLVFAPTAALAQDRNNNARSYHDAQHNDDHQWNSHEDKAYKIYTKQNHRKNTQFSRLKDNDQQAYWGWRHEHSDALLKINIR